MAAWTLQYAHKHREGTNAAMARGHAVEHGLKYFHNGSEFDDPAEEAIKEFNKLTAFGVEGAAREREADNVPKMVSNYPQLWDGKLPKIGSYQNKIELEIDGIDVPLIGFTDFEFDDRVIDIKTTTRLPSQISTSHRMQGAVYQKASGNRAVEFIYLTPTKSARYLLEDSEDDWTKVCQIANRLQKFLGNFESVEELTAAVLPNYDSFYWNNPETRSKGEEIFGF